MFGRGTGSSLFAPGMFNSHVCGCYYVSAAAAAKRFYLPQVQLDSHTIIGLLCFTTRLTQTFRNANTATIDEVRYTFPLYDGVAVSAYTIRYAGKVLKGVVKQKDDARRTYDAAISRGETAGLLESLPAGIFGVTLGNVPGGADVIVEITYCGELRHDAGIDGLRYLLPTTIAPRHGEYPGELLGGNVVKSGISITVDVDMTGSAIRKVQSPSHPISVSIGSTSTTSPATAFRSHQASATLTLGTTELGADFVLQLLVDDLDAPRAVLETHPTLPAQRAIMATLVPRFALKPAYPEIVFIADQSGSMQGSKNAALVKALNVFLKSLPLGVRFNLCAFGNGYRYLWPISQAYTAGNVQKALDFVAGCTASMGGTEILNPIRAAFEQKLEGMPLEVMILTDGQVWQEKGVFDYINLMIKEKKVDARVFALGIGNGVSTTLVEGIARAGNGFAHFVGEGEEEGETGRKVVRMLKGALFAHTRDYRVEVLYAKDKEAEARSRSEEEDSETVLTPAAEEGDDDEFELIEKLTCGLKLDDQPPPYPETGGTMDTAGKPAKLFFDAAVDLDKPTDGTLERYAHLPAIDIPQVIQAPAEIPPFFPFTSTTVYILLGPETPEKKITAIKLHATSDEGSIELTVPVSRSETTNEIPTVHHLAARKAIQDLEEGRGWLQSASTTADAQHKATLLKTKYASRFDELIEREAVRLGEHFQVAGKWTSFVAVEEGSGQDYPASIIAKQKGNVELDVAIHSARMAPHNTHSIFGQAAEAILQKGDRLDALRVVPGAADSIYAARKQRSSRTSLFGNVNASGASGGWFGRSSPSPAAGGSGVKLASAAPASTAGGLFGKASESNTGGSVFGSQSSNATSSCFGNSFVGSASPSASGGLFGGLSSATSGLFGGSKPMARPHPQMDGFGTPLFGSSSHASPPPPSASQNMQLPPPPPPPSGAPRGPVASSCFAPPNIDRVQEFHDGAAHDSGLLAYTNDMAKAAPLNLPRGTNGVATSKSTKQLGRPDQNPVAAMHKLIFLQTFSGAWLWSTELCSTLGTNQSVMRQWQSYGGLGTAVKATALVIAYLMRDYGGQKDVWDMVSTKAMEWLTRETKLEGDDLLAVVREAGRKLGEVQNARA
ncbi:hypothetical protein LTR53_001746 [Teratosphaeriaceae sp. CCFEE 6253]|nr:hypothetical protein LTR53_001746 [Teratosphaeriaceae sp. CCFEE 6253]